VEAYAESDRATRQTLPELSESNHRHDPGFCIGAEWIAVCCDLRVCDEKSASPCPAAKLGLGYGFVHING